MTYFKRPLLPLLVAYVAGLALGKWSGAVYWGVGAFLAATAISAWRRDTTLLVMAAVFCGGLVVGGLLRREDEEARHLMQRLSPPIAAKMVGRVVALDISDGETPWFVVGHAYTVTEAGTFALPGKILVTVSTANAAQERQIPAIGEIVEVTGALDTPRTHVNFFGFDYRDSLARKGIYASLQGSHWEILEAVPSSQWLSQALMTLRRCAAESLQRFLPPDEARWATSMVFNDRRQLTPTEQSQLRDANLMHLFAVSGLHVGALAAAALLVLRALRVSWLYSWSFVAVLAWVYTALTGFVPSAQRATAMVTAYAASRWARREIDPVSALAAGCFGLLLWNPRLHNDVAFLLSVTGVLGIVTFFPLLRSIFPDPEFFSKWPFYFQKFLSLVTDGFRVTLGVSLLILPLQLYFFNQVNLLSPLGNVFCAMLAVPIVGSALAIVGVGVFSAPLAVLLGAATAFLLNVLMTITDVIANQDWAILRVPRLSPAAVFGYYAVLFSGYYIVRRDTPEFVPKARAQLLIRASLACLILVVATAWQRSDRRLKIWFFDVGQGSSALVQLPTGQSFLIDCGNRIPNMARLVVIPQLRALGCWPLDDVLITHEDSDHAGSLPKLLEEWKVSTLVFGRDVVAPERYLMSASSLKVFPRIERICAGYRVLIDRELELAILNPDCETSPTLASNNDRSVVVRLQYKNFAVLFTGDCEHGAEGFMLNQGIKRCDVLLVGHHGSASSTGEAFLEAVDPQVAIISCGRRNRYGHPAPAVIQRLMERHVVIYRTDRHGAICVATDGDHFEMRTAASARGSRNFPLE